MMQPQVQNTFTKRSLLMLSQTQHFVQFMKKDLMNVGTQRFVHLTARVDCWTEPYMLSHLHVQWSYLLVPRCTHKVIQNIDIS